MRLAEKIKTLLFSVLLTSVAVLSFANEIVLTENGKSEFKLVVPSELQVPLKEDIAEFLRCFKAATGTELPVLSSADSKRILLQVNSSREGDPEAFSFTFPDKNTIIISGGSLHGVRFALSDFLERYVGCRWLFPGELGEVIPKVDKLVVPRKAVSEKPYYLSRHAGAGAFTPHKEI